MTELLAETLEAWPNGLRYPLLADVLGGPDRCDLGQLMSAVLDGIAEPFIEPAVAVARHTAAGRFTLANAVLADLATTEELSEQERAALSTAVDRAERDAGMRFDRRRNELMQRAKRAEMPVDSHPDLSTATSWSVAESAGALDAWERDIVEWEDKLAEHLRGQVDPQAAPEWVEAVHTSVDAKEFPSAKEIIEKGPVGFEAGPTATVRISSWPWPDVSVTEVLAWHASNARANTAFNERWRPAVDDQAAIELVGAIGALCDAVDENTVRQFAAAVDGLLDVSGVSYTVGREEGGFHTTIKGLLDPRLAMSLPREMVLWAGPPGWSPPRGRSGVWFQLARETESPPPGVAVLRPDTLYEMIAHAPAHRRTVASRRIHLLRAICRQLELADLVGTGPRLNLGVTTQLRTDLAWLFDLMGIRVDGGVLDTVLYDTSGHPVALRGALEFLIGERGRRSFQITMDDVARWRADERALGKLCDQIKDGLDNAGTAVLALLLRDDAEDLGPVFQSDELMYLVPNDMPVADEAEAATTLAELLDLSAAMSALVADGLVVIAETSGYRFRGPGLRALLRGSADWDDVVRHALDGLANRLRTVLESVQVSLSQQAILHWIKNDIAALRLQVDHIRPSFDRLPPDLQEIWRLLSATLDRLKQAHQVSQDNIRDLLVPKQFDLYGALQELVFEEDRYQRFAKVSLEDAETMTIVEASHLLVTSALRNLLTNAVQAIAGQQKGVEGQVTVSLRVESTTAAGEHRKWAQVRIADSGPGFSDDLRARFERGERFSNRDGGEGNGLRFAKAQLSYCGGALTLLPVAGSLGGAQVQVRLPLVTVR